MQTKQETQQERLLKLWHKTFITADKNTKWKIRRDIVWGVFNQGDLESVNILRYFSANSSIELAEILESDTKQLEQEYDAAWIEFNIFKVPIGTFSKGAFYNAGIYSLNLREENYQGECLIAFTEGWRKTLRLTTAGKGEYPSARELSAGFVDCIEHRAKRKTKRNKEKKALLEEQVLETFSPVSKENIPLERLFDFLISNARLVRIIPLVKQALVTAKYNPDLALQEIKSELQEVKDRYVS